jgi:hypothetical protein
MSTNPAENGSSLLDSLIVEDIDDIIPEQSTPNAKASRPRLRDRVKKESDNSSNTRKARVPPKRKEEFVEPLMGMYTMLGVAITPFDSHCGPIVISQAEPCARSLDDLAEKNEQVRKALRSLTQASALGNVIMAHAPILIAVASHHMPGMMPFNPRQESDDNGDLSTATIT